MRIFLSIYFQIMYLALNCENTNASQQSVRYYDIRCEVWMGRWQSFTIKTKESYQISFIHSSTRPGISFKILGWFDDGKGVT